MPLRAKILSVGAQGEGLYLWALVDPQASKEIRHFHVLGTGHHVIPDHLGVFIGTVQMDTDDGELVWHIWEDA